ncbi:hypothetical protein PJK54_17060 [Cobetia sp. MMG027]|uniref:PssD/Cps14F family polysaccharide biosynthesis glycosyltransferase n=1 Tax=Cobetia sp. MMG027 TaxID=3021980 RepID=UPI0022FEEEF6|nr:PssD/Cps14F family polysaccharide biosynthesis glycosyltransferase [Cobetia sp. MMG027]MDA5565373.1 hypothetical protein [Cobetia sp. MMG027]
MYFIVAGEGGHFAQAKRLIALADQTSKDRIVHISDNENCKLSNICVTLKPLRCKDSNYCFTDLSNFIKNIIVIYKSFGSYNNVRVVSLGPGIAIPVALIGKIKGAKIIHIETWSRITSKSITGRIMYFLSDKFIVQHKSLVKIYPKSIYGGLL